MTLYNKNNLLKKVQKYVEKYSEEKKMNIIFMLPI